MNDKIGTIDMLQTPGIIIRDAREKRNISLADVAQKLLLSKNILANIEEDDYSKIPAQVYAEGYLKAYAQILDLPIDLVIDSFRRLNVYADEKIKEVDKSSDDRGISLKKVFDFFQTPKGKAIFWSVAVALILGISVLFVVKFKPEYLKMINVNLVTAEVLEESKDDADDATLEVIVDEQADDSNLSESDDNDNAAITDDSIDTVNIDIPLTRVFQKRQSKG